MKLSNTSIPHLIIVALITLYAAMAQAQNLQDWEENDVPMVGRVSHLEGTLTRYDTDQDDWVEVTQYAPVGAGDRLYSDPDAKAELILPNNAWIRIAGDTEVELTTFDENFTDIDLTLGMVRLYNKSSTAKIITTTPFGEVVTPAGSHTDLYVYSDGVEIIAITNPSYFVHNRSNRRNEISDTGAALFADKRQVSASRTAVATDWGKWNIKMDALWAMRTQTQGESNAYLPPALRHDAYALDTHGQWDRVYYQGDYYRFWRPIHVHAGWAPFSSGVWRVRWRDHVWIPHEPFGYVTHHYGNWIHTAGYWYWAPPVTRVMINAGLPLFRIGFAWYPGRVAWIHANAHVGWFPLAPYEPYYSHRRWGRRAHFVGKHRHLHHRRHNYKHRRHAVVIHKDHMYRGKNYRDARVKNISRKSAVGRFRTAPVLNRSVVKDYRNRPGTDRFKRLQKVRKLQPIRSRENRHDRQVTNNAERTRTLSQTHNRRPDRIKRFTKPGASAHRDQIKTRKQKHAQSNSRPPNPFKVRKSKKVRQANSVDAQAIKRNAPPPANIKASKPHKSRRQNNGKVSTGERFKRGSIHKVTPQRSADGRQSYGRQTQIKQRRPPQPNNTGISRNRPIEQHSQGQGYNARDYSPNKYQGGRTSGFSTGGRRGSRSRR